MITGMFIVNIILLLVLLPGGFFMFRAFLRRMRQEEGHEQHPKNENM